VASQWRIRHKLMLGLGLVVGIIALLLGGSLYGLYSYINTSRIIASKLQEETEAVDFMEAVSRLTVVDYKAERADEVEQLRISIGLAKDGLTACEERLQETLKRRRDPDQGHTELGTIGKLHEQFTQLERAIDDERKPISQDESTTAIIKRKSVEPAVQNLQRTSHDLHRVIYDSIQTRLHEAKGYHRNSLVIVVSTSVLGVLLMAGLLRFFYGWMFNPIRDLQRGAGRVAQGDFEHRIEVHSGDEMEDLAAAFNDMTSRLQEMYRDLAHQVNERSRQLVRSERLASVGFLAAGVAHEINNPLASIAFCSEALEDRIADIVARAPGESKVVIKYLKMIQQEAFRCKSITQRLLDFSRTGERRREATDLAELVQSVLDMVQTLQNYKSMQINFESNGPVYAWVNGQEIKSVVLNLVVNALESMEEDGTLTITLDEHDRMAKLVLTDSGCGMSEEILENIFEPFFTRSRTGKGTGLGLSISHRVITQHGGEIEAASPGPNQGSTFTVRLPLQPAEPVKEESVAHAAA
jgi:signal transduction histidine kinase